MCRPRPAPGLGRSDRLLGRAGRPASRWTWSGERLADGEHGWAKAAAFLWQVGAVECGVLDTSRSRNGVYLNDNITHTELPWGRRRRRACRTKTKPTFVFLFLVRRHRLLAGTVSAVHYPHTRARAATVKLWPASVSPPAPLQALPRRRGATTFSWLSRRGAERRGISPAAPASRGESWAAAVGA